MRITSAAAEVRLNLTYRCPNFQRARVEEFRDVVSVSGGEEELRFLAEGRGP